MLASWAHGTQREEGRMVSKPYEPDVYRRFADNLGSVLKGDNIEHPSMRILRKKALATARMTKNGSPLWYSKVSSRIAAKTVYLAGADDVVLPKPTPLQLSIVEKAPEQLHKTLQLLKTMPFVHVRRQMCDNDDFNPVCDLYVCVADTKNYRLAYEWACTMGDIKKGAKGPTFTMIDIPEEHMMRMQVLSLPEHDINIAMGTDYTGECKKGFLRQAMFRADRLGMLGLHAGTKVVRTKDGSSGKLKTVGVFLFGLTATGKSTWSCHQLGLDSGAGEGTWVAQDDIALLQRDGSAYGTEQGFYVKTDVAENLQEAMYRSLVHKSALLENVMVNAGGEVDFLDQRLGENARGVLDRRKLTVKRGKKTVSICADSINLPSLEKLDGLVFAFITRRHTVMPFAQRLTPKQGVLAYLWGESTHSFATVPEKAGESVRIVGTDPFIVGARGRKVNAFYDIVMDLVKRYPGKVHFFQYNTGGVGELIEVDPENGEKNLLRKVRRVPIDLMAALQRGDLRGTNEYRKGRFNTEEVVGCEGFDLKEFDPADYYSEEQIAAFVHDIVAGRRAYTEQIATEGLHKDILELALRELDSMGGGSSPRERRGPDEIPEKDEVVTDENRLPLSPYITPWEHRRPGRDLLLFRHSHKENVS